MKSLLFSIIICSPIIVSAQSLLDELDSGPSSEPIEATFKGTRIVNGHSVKVKTNGELEFLISHRFGRVNTGLYELFGLDAANMRLALEYGLTENFEVGLGRSSFNKTVDSFAKYRAIRQSEGGSPITATLFGSAAIETIDKNLEFNHRLAFVGQALIARKFNSDLSLQISPSIIHFNLVQSAADPFNIFALGIGGRYKLSNRVSVNAEYFPQFSKLESTPTFNVLSFGFDIETGGHVFQIIVTNTQTMLEKAFITETTGDWGNGDIHLGFNISRTFQLRTKQTE